MSDDSNNRKGGKVKIIGGYTVERRLGAGSFATVYKGVRQSQNNPNCIEIVAIKAISRKGKKLTPKVLENLDLEIAILKSYRHPNIVALHNVQKTERHFYLFLEFCGGGDVQQLIRTRKKGRLSERLTRRLMKDLTSGLKFLWGKSVMHRDIKPQNLLLSGPLPLDEMNDECTSPADELKRQQANFPSNKFALKIADFGFARPLETASLAETLCGSPLYMAPEILEGQKYDAKADLWSVGTVLFEMVAGRPPFMGDNHIHLLRNIQTKSLRMPEGVKVSQECVNLLRLLLNRKPKQRAGFQSFFESSNAFVSLGCEGNVIPDSQTPIENQVLNRMDTVPESASSQETMIPAASQMHQNQTPPQNILNEPQPIPNPNSTHAHALDSHQILATPPTPATPINLMHLPNEPSYAQLNEYKKPTNHDKKIVTSYTSQNQRQPHQFIPLAPSPPGPSVLRKPDKAQGSGPPQLYLDSNVAPKNISNPYISHLPTAQRSNYPSAQAQYSRRHLLQNQDHHQRKNDSSLYSESDSEFVMVEHGNAGGSTYISTNSKGQVQGNLRPNATPPPPTDFPQPASPAYLTAQPKANNSSTHYVRHSSILSKGRYNISQNGMLPTSPNQGKDLLKMMLNPQYVHAHVKSDLSLIIALLATAEDIGRRAVNVAQIGDSRSFVAMRLLANSLEDEFHLRSISPMGNEDSNENYHDSGEKKVQSHLYQDSNDSKRDEMKNCLDKGDIYGNTMTRMNSNGFNEGKDQDDENDEMPFAVMDSDAGFPNSPSLENKSGRIASLPLPQTQKQTSKPSNSQILCCFREALSCYLKSLSLMKGAVHAVQLLKENVSVGINHGIIPTGGNDTSVLLMQRCDSSCQWLSSQFSGVLERADACNMEISKINGENLSGSDALSAEELIYNHSLMCGRDGAVKQLLGQYESAKACYRSAGLLIEVLLMEPNVVTEDQKVLNEYVNGFTERIKELDYLLSSNRENEQRIANNSPKNTIQTHERGEVVGLVGEVMPQLSGNSNQVPNFA